MLYELRSLWGRAVHYWNSSVILKGGLCAWCRRYIRWNTFEPVVWRIIFCRLGRIFDIDVTQCRLKEQHSYLILTGFATYLLNWPTKCDDEHEDRVRQYGRVEIWRNFERSYNTSTEDLKICDELFDFSARRCLGGSD